jgi:hypothetical protein
MPKNREITRENRKKYISSGIGTLRKKQHHPAMATFKHRPTVVIPGLLGPGYFVQNNAGF